MGPFPRILTVLRDGRAVARLWLNVAVLIGELLVLVWLFLWAATAPADAPIPLINPDSPWRP